ncbi:MAG: hypothetical protein PHU63_02720 [Candidatus ainarchaeum sp.]|nr:hypothetical protein [Candidatus ainarchaeum sp.]
MFGFSFSALTSCVSDTIAACCEIDAPSVSGHYSLVDNITTSNGNSTCIQITQDNITLNLNGNKISNINGDNNKAISVEANNVTITNGSIENSYYGISCVGLLTVFNNLTITNISIGPSLTEASSGISLERCNNVTISNISIFDLSNNSTGLYVQNLTYFSLTDAYFSYLNSAIEIIDVDYVNISFVEIEECDYGFELDARSKTISNANFTHSTIDRCFVGLEFSEEHGFDNILINYNNITNSFYSIAFDSGVGGLGDNAIFYVINGYINFTNTLIDDKEILVYTNSSGISPSNPAVLFLYNISDSEINNLDLSFSSILLYIIGSENLTFTNTNLAYSSVPLSIFGSSNISFDNLSIETGNHFNSLGFYALGINNTIINNSRFSDSVFFNMLIILGENISIHNTNISHLEIVELISSLGLFSDDFAPSGITATLVNNFNIYNVNINSSQFSIDAIPDEIDGRPSKSRFVSSGGDLAVPPPDPKDCSLDSFIYTGIFGISLLFTNYIIESSLIEDFNVGFYSNNSNGSILQTRFLNTTETVYFVNSEAIFNRNLIGPTTFVNLYQNNSAYEEDYCSLHLQFRSKNSSINFTNNTLSGKMYSVEYTGGNLTLNATSNPTPSSPFKTALNQFISITNLSVGSELNLTFHYGNNLVENTLRMYKYNGTWNYVLNILGVNCTTNTTANYLKCSNITSLSVFGLFGDYKTDDGDDDPPITTTPSLSISSEQNCNQQAIVLSINDDEGNPVSNSKVIIEKLISGNYQVHGSYSAQNSLFQFLPLSGNTYRAKAVKTGYEESDYIYFTYSCEAESQCTVSVSVDCEEGIITFSAYKKGSNDICILEYPKDIDENLEYIDPCADEYGGGCGKGLGFTSYSFYFYENKEYSLTFGLYDYKAGTTEDVTIIANAICLNELNEFIFNYDYYCADNNELGLEENVAVLTITDQNGECIHAPYSINLSDLTIYTPQEMYTGPAALVKYDPYACLEQIPFIFEEDASYTISIEKDGFIPGTSTTSFSCTNQFNITDVIVDCDSNLLNFKMTDENGESVPFPYIIDAGELGYYEGQDILLIAHMDQSTYHQESTFSGFKTISNYYGKKYTVADYTIEYPTLFSIPFTDDGDYSLTFTKEGFEEYTEYVSISCDSLDEEEIPDDENIIIIDKEGNKVDKNNLSPGEYVMLLTDDKGQIVASKILTILEKPQPEPEDDLLDSILSQGSSILLLTLLLLGLGLYLYQRRSSVNIKRKK